MVGLSLRFLAGKYHATPWGHHVNEGAVEWPPSPWRILRALTATWIRTCPDIPELAVREVLKSLGSPPSYFLPPATVGHARYFMPWKKGWKAKRDQARTLVFDAFVALDPATSLRVFWPDVEFSPDQETLVRNLLGNLPHLGRAEAWCEARYHRFDSGEFSRSEDGRILNEKTGEILANSVPAGNSERQEEEEGVRLLCPSESFDWNQPLVDDHPFLMDTRTLRRKNRRILPPGSHWVTYHRPEACFQLDPSLYVSRKPGPDEVHIARFRIQGTGRPTIEDAIRFGELARRAAMSWYGRLHSGASSPILSGKDEDGKPLQDQGHAFFLPTDEDGDGRIDHLTVHAPSGLGQSEQRALGALRVLNPGNGRPEVRLVLAGMLPITSATLQGLALIGPARQWRSTSPVVSTRHPKQHRNGKPKLRADGRQIDGLEDQVYRELELRGYPKPESVSPIEANRRGRGSTRWLEFRRWRRGGGRKGQGLPQGFRLVFSEPVLGPIALGYGAHFGLGLFVAEEPSG